MLKCVIEYDIRMLTNKYDRFINCNKKNSNARTQQHTERFSAHLFIHVVETITQFVIQ